MREKNVLCGAGRVTRLDATNEFWLSHASRGRWEGRAGDPDRDLAVVEGSDDDGYNSNRTRSISTMSCRVATSPGFLSEYKSDTSCVNGVGHELRRAKQPMEDVDRALKQRKSSWRI